MTKVTGYEFSTTGDEVVSRFQDSIKGKTIVITGPGQGGIGSETAVALAAAAPALLILTGRTESKITPVILEIESKNSAVKVQFVKLDLSSQASVRSAAAVINESVEKIDILINNAGIMACPYEKSVDGIELQFATNHIGHFLLTKLVMQKILNAGPGSRIVNVSSVGHRMAGVRFDDYNFQDGKAYSEWEAYGQSKTANILFTYSLAKKLGGKGVFAYSLHPGSIRSGLQVHLNESNLPKGFALLAAADAKTGQSYAPEPVKTLQQGCATTLVAALDPSLEAHNGAFLWNSDIADPLPPAHATSEENAEKLWVLSETLVGEKFEFVI
ncbi:hypothetical protein SERLA73DRAFT_79315 [Serpula lacrymans var. lacrymans S7.3]|uniref:Uncharacterized protein n=2 Tax=Serpula lacrymans var. lacrymans TaxID=341189 RepID=F8QFZ5_SERL3|nr:uncharacterized protein SERLADRAFT_463440 [Serpula lacrymans var. lacrymans S7.9]EGN92743.1 hypothetical protein SERLA73DRAFT_79315 [Serpula lacrymans var. lacrymans S7.3]EGO26404.1 hypothetical protein SERLADRAFT_463440 [Serpula lacrymans var. lacrymans S7.9]